jgi:hypothetical protein
MRVVREDRVAAPCRPSSAHWFDAGSHERRATRASAAMGAARPVRKSDVGPGIGTGECRGVRLGADERRSKREVDGVRNS